ncbi:MAG: hypothetical protein ACYCX2_03055 [Christensenellales bacterium]
MKKIICSLLVLFLIFSCLAGCSNEVTAAFYVNGELYETASVKPKQDVSVQIPLVTGFSFLGWYAKGTDYYLYDFSSFEPVGGMKFYAKFRNVFTGEETFSPAALPEDNIMADYEAFDKYGKVLAAAKIEDGVYIVAEGYAQHGYYGYYKTPEEKSASMTVGVVISGSGVITKAVNLASYNQGEGYAQKITDDYLASSYQDAESLPTLEAQPVTGATGTSKAANYAVQAAAYYAEKAYGFAPDTSDADKAELEAVYSAKYTVIKTDYKVDEKSIGTVVYAAEGTAPDGKQVVAMKVTSAKNFSYAGFASTGWDEAEPSPYTMVIVIDKATNKVTAWRVLVDGTKKKDYFTVPEEKINQYMAVEITSEGVFDSFKDGLILDLDVETEKTSDGSTIITGTSIVYTGASEDGTLSSQLVRLCFKTAAYFYSNYK